MSTACKGYFSPEKLKKKISTLLNLKATPRQVELLAKELRRDALRERKERLEKEQGEREADFVRSLNEAHEASLRRLQDQHRSV